jgi:hypothetical protein
LRKRASAQLGIRIMSGKKKGRSASEQGQARQNDTQDGQSRGWAKDEIGGL